MAIGIGLAMFILANNINGRCYTICRGQEIEQPYYYYRVFKRVHATCTRIHTHNHHVL